ncbi:tRNA threonylcarbamoyladenosine biosynthesis protein TsaB [Amorphus suaedae]
MHVLVLDTALDACQAVVGSADGVAAHERLMPSVGQSEAIVALADKALATAGLTYSDIGRIGVVVGPGSFTGLRIGVAAARALALVVGCPVVGISSLAAIAASVPDRGRQACAVAIDARHGAVYAQLFETGAIPVGEAAHVPIEAFAATLPAGAILAGSGAVLLAEAIAAAGGTPGRVEPVAAPEADALVRLVLAAQPPFPPARPAYLKAPDAKPAVSLVGARR